MLALSFLNRTRKMTDTVYRVIQNSHLYIFSIFKKIIENFNNNSVVILSEIVKYFFYIFNGNKIVFEKDISCLEEWMFGFKIILLKTKITDKLTLSLHKIIYMSLLKMNYYVSDKNTTETYKFFESNLPEILVNVLNIFINPEEVYPSLRGPLLSFITSCCSFNKLWILLNNDKDLFYRKVIM